MSNTHGSAWRKWDLHVHTPASFEWNDGKRLREMSSDKEKNIAIIRVLEAINRSDVSVFSIMDYWTFDGFLAIREAARQHPNLLTKTVFPGIELRVEAPTRFRLNVHALLSDTLSDQQLRDFLGELKIQMPGPSAGLRSLSPEAIVQYARTLPAKQFKNNPDLMRLQSDEFYAWKIGSETIEVTLDSFRSAMESLPDGTGVVFQPWDTYNGFSYQNFAEWSGHYTAVQKLFTHPDIFECKDPGVRDAFIGRKSAANAKYFSDFWTALNERARLPVRGSDAHRTAEYGQFPSGLTTWIKAETTFRGLLQAIKEPAQRSWLGATPPKKAAVEANPAMYIKSVSIAKSPSSKLANEDWFDGVNLPLNPDLVAVIGNKGSGKSALADIVALLGNTTQSGNFSFLSERRFRERRKNRSADFEATLTWMNDLTSTRSLGGLHEPGDVERVRYVPQAFFEQICAGHSDEELEKFTAQIEHTLFSHIPASLKGNATSFRELLGIAKQEKDRSIIGIRAEVRRLNDQICEARRRSTPSIRSELVAKQALREQRLKDLKAAEPPNNVSAIPQVSAEQSRIGALKAQEEKLATERQKSTRELASVTAQYQAIKRIQAALGTLAAQVESEKKRLQADASVAELSLDDTIEFRVDSEMISVLVAKVTDRGKSLRDAIDGVEQTSIVSREKVIKQGLDAELAKLSATQRTVQAERDRRVKWEREVDELGGSDEGQASIAFVLREIAKFDDIPNQIKSLTADRDRAAQEVARAILEIRDVRDGFMKEAKSSIDERLKSHPNFSIEFVNTVDFNELETSFFEIVKQQSGTFRGDSEGRRALQKLIDSCPGDTPESLIALAQSIEKAVTTEVRGEEEINHDLEAMLRKGSPPEDLLNLIYEFNWLKPRFTLAQDGQPLEQLSPGQRGALLLLFFLLVEDSDLPIVLDQPEENLDNQTVYSLLVPAIKEAKERRQIIMVTHNANLAVCCDAEQIIHAKFERGNRNKITYSAGAIEDPAINALVVDVLEGTRPAFENRKSKY